MTTSRGSSESAARAPIAMSAVAGYELRSADPAIPGVVLVPFAAAFAAGLVREPPAPKSLGGHLGGDDSGRHGQYAPSDQHHDRCQSAAEIGARNDIAIPHR